MKLNMRDIIIKSVFVVTFYLFFLSVWILAFKILSKSSGWKYLAEEFPLINNEFNLRDIHSLQMIIFRDTVRMQGNTISVNQYGIKFSTFFAFRFFHKPFFVPWSELSGSCYYSKGQLIGLIEIKNIKITIYGSVVKYLSDKNYIKSIPHI